MGHSSRRSGKPATRTREGQVFPLAFFFGSGVTARTLQLEFKGALHYVTSRRGGRKDIYLADGDRSRFLEILGEVWERFNWTTPALCQVTNHYHLVVL